MCRNIDEDISQGATILAAGKKLTPPDIGLLASLGLPEIKVTKINFATRLQGCFGEISFTNGYAASGNNNIGIISGTIKAV
jgi:hypothetical protein